MDAALKIGLIGPTYPFRGGVSHHTTLLCKALRKHHEVTFLSFRRQYPTLLFPGRSDREPRPVPAFTEPVRYAIDPFNPVTWLRAADEMADFGTSTVLIPWWTAYWAPMLVTLLHRVKTRCSTITTLICHNVADHEPAAWKNAAARMVLSRADRIVTQSGEETLRVRALLGSARRVVTGFHPTYAGLCGSLPSRASARNALGVSGHVLLFFGMVRKYKGLDVLIEAMSGVLNKQEVTLLIVGEFWQNRDRYERLIRRRGIEAHVRITDRYVSLADMGRYIAAADLAVLPYHSVSGSGVIQLAYGYDLPVIATDVDGLSNVIRDRVNGRLVPAGEADALSEAILESLVPDVLQGLKRNSRDVKERFSWDRFLQTILE